MSKEIQGQDFFIPHSMIVKGKVRGVVWVLDRDAFLKAEEIKDDVEDIIVDENGNAEAKEIISPFWSSFTAAVDRYLEIRPFGSTPVTRRINNDQDLVRSLRQVSISVGKGELSILFRYGVDGYPEMVFLGSNRAVLQRHVTKDAWYKPTIEEFNAWVKKCETVMNAAGLQQVPRN